MAHDNLSNINPLLLRLNAWPIFKASRYLLNRISWLINQQTLNQTIPEPTDLTLIEGLLGALPALFLSIGYILSHLLKHNAISLYRTMIHWMNTAVSDMYIHENNQKVLYQLVTLSPNKYELAMMTGKTIIEPNYIYVKNIDGKVVFSMIKPDGSCLHSTKTEIDAPKPLISKINEVNQQLIDDILKVLPSPPQYRNSRQIASGIVGRLIGIGLGITAFIVVIALRVLINAALHVYHNFFRGARSMLPRQSAMRTYFEIPADQRAISENGHGYSYALGIPLGVLPLGLVSGLLGCIIGLGLRLIESVVPQKKTLVIKPSCAKKPSRTVEMTPLADSSTKTIKQKLVTQTAAPSQHTSSNTPITSSLSSRLTSAMSFFFPSDAPPIPDQNKISKLTF